MVLLQEKHALHRMVHRIGEGELREIARLVLIGLVILPLLPDKSYGQNGLLNPFSIWLMVVLIVGISLAAYLASKYLGEGKGTVVAGILGGLISSTATTVSLARRSRNALSRIPPLAAIALISAAVVFLRVIVEVVIMGPLVYVGMLPPLLAMLAISIVIAVVWHRIALRSEPLLTADEPPPSELKGAIMFGLMYVLVLFAVEFAKDQFGHAGLYAVAAISGLTDMDAITLSTASLCNAGEISPDTAWRVILTGGLANVFFKGGLVLSMGSRPFIKPVLLGFLTTLLGGAAILSWWP
jgi:uncharacterized membrane protein (DUF4010 family)